MSTIRRQSIISSGIIYMGFALGFLNNFLFARLLTPAQYGLIGVFLAIGSIMYFFANLGMPAYINKFYPYYNDNLPVRENDMMNWALLIGLSGFTLVIAASLIFRGQVIHYFEARSSELVTYYFWILPFGFGYTLYFLLEAFAWQVKESIRTSYLREVVWRLLVLALLTLYLTGILANFGVFVRLYSFAYLAIGILLLIYLLRKNKLHFVFTPSRVTKKFLPKIRALAFLTWGGQLVFNVAFFFGQIVIAAVVTGGLTSVGIYTLALYIGSLVQAPQRGIMAAAVGPLSQAWKDKDYDRIQRIYRRSAITQLIFSVGMFILIWINFSDGVYFFHLNNDYLAAQAVFLFIGLARIIDMGTGVNNQIILTSTFWRWDFFSGLILLSLTLPLNYILAKKMGITGPAIADLFTFALYNFIRWLILYRKFRMQPFDRKTLYTLLLGGAGYLICYWLFGGYHGFPWMVARSVTFIIFYMAGVLGLRLSEDVMPVWQTVKKRIGISR